MMPCKLMTSDQEGKQITVPGKKQDKPKNPLRGINPTLNVGLVFCRGPFCGPFVGLVENLNWEHQDYHRIRLKSRQKKTDEN